MNESGKTFPIVDNGINPLGILPVPQNITPWRYLFLAYVYKSIALVNELLEVKVLILSLVFTITFNFLSTLLITLVLDERYIVCLIKM